MMRSQSIRSSLPKLLFGLCLLTALPGCIRLPPIEITFPLDVNIDLSGFQRPGDFTFSVGGNYDFVLSTGSLEGTPIPDQPSDQMVLTDFPSEQDIVDSVRDEIQQVTVVGDPVIRSITLKSIRLIATTGDFSTISRVSLYFVPKPVGGVPQEALLLASAQSSSGFGDDIPLAAAPGVNLFDLIQRNDSNPAPGDPTSYLEVIGIVPPVLPAWSTDVIIEADGAATIQTTPTPFCEFPNADTVSQMIRASAGDFVAGLIAVDSLELMDVTLTATENNFSALEEIAVFYVPKPVDSIDQPPVELGEGSEPGGFSDLVVLAPPEGTTVDLYALVRDNDANPAPDCPSAYLTVTGGMPEALPTWTTQVRVSANLILFPL